MRHDKISPGLLLAFEDFQREGDEASLTHKRSLGIVSPKTDTKPTRIVVFIYCDEDTDLSHLSGFGIEINQSRGSVRTAYLPIDELDRLSEEPKINRVKPSRKLEMRMEMASDKVYLPQFKQKHPELTGKGILVGIVDSGIDPQHPAFKGRILRIWDQTLPGPGVAEGLYGAELKGDLLKISQDTNGHGTHVAGIAAGNGEFSGVAPEAELVIVKTDMQDAHIADAIRYIFRVADEMECPAVVNLSLGGHADGHDGSDSLSNIINDQTGPGRIVCCAAGNEGNDNIHAQAVVKSKNKHTMRFQVPRHQTGIVWLNGWYGGDSKLEISLRSPNGFVTPFQAITTKGNPAKEYKLFDARVEIVTPGPDPANGDHNFFVQIRGQGWGRFSAPVAGGVWQLRVRNTTSKDTCLDVWTLDDNGGSVFFTGKSVSDAVKIGSPAAAKNAVTVASYTTKVQYTDIDGEAREMGLELDTISEFSSEGPLRNNEQKPDIAAPGAMIISALSSQANFDRSMMHNSEFVALAGTSMATPFVSGLVALLLQRDPNLDPVSVKEILRKNSSIPNQAAGHFDRKWGFGLIDTKNL
ncbi:MAG: S8 family peptidase [Calothrix sp. MO_167.B42]|nr:S8 family peptidase [Calothrix sp. MO_167.B42]